MSIRVDKSFDVRKILAEVEQYQPFDSLEKKHKNTLLEWLKTVKRPLDASCFDEQGHATGSAFIISRVPQKVVLIYHKKLRRWLQPGGHAELGEPDLLTAAIREVREEIGLELPRNNASLLDLDVHRIPRLKNQPSHFHFDFRYLFMLDKPLPLKVGSDAKLARWFSCKEMEELELDKGLKRMFKKCKFRGVL